MQQFFVKNNEYNIRLADGTYVEELVYVDDCMQGNKQVHRFEDRMRQEQVFNPSYISYSRCIALANGDAPWRDE